MADILKTATSRLLGLFLLGLIHLSSASSWRGCRAILMEERERALSDIQTVSSHENTKFWFAHLSEKEFEASIQELEAISIYFLNAEYSAFLKSLLQTQVGRDAFAKLSDIDMSEKFRRELDPEIGEVMFNALVFRLLNFEQHEAIESSKDIFLEEVAIVRGFRLELDRLSKRFKNIASLSEQVLRDSFGHYLAEGAILSRPTEESVVSRSWFSKWSYEVDKELTDPRFDLHQIIYAYNDWPTYDGPFKQLIKKPWEFYVKKRREHRFRFVEREIFQVMSAAVQNTYKMRAEFVSDFFYSLEAFEFKFLKNTSPSLKNHFLVNLQHNLPVLIKAISVDEKGEEVSALMMTSSVYKILAYWCDRFDMPVPDYVPVANE